MATQAMTAQIGIEVGRWSVSRDHAAERNEALRAAQQRIRRGPTPEMLFAKHFDNSRLVKAPDPVRAKEMRAFARVMLLLFGLIMVYGWQHFSGIEYGYHIETERAQLRQLQEQNRQLRLTEAQLVSPERIDPLVREMGFAVPTPNQVVRPDGSLGTSGPALAETRPLLPSLH